MDIKWNFPNNGGGQIRGVSDAGIETFTGSEIKSLAREICQNSLDASESNKDSCTKVEFKRYRIMNREIPGYYDYKEIVNKALSYWSKENNEKAMEFLKRTKDEIENTYCYVLRISDYNTVGLSDPYGESSSGWNSLIKIDGGATKSGDKAGAFGIGKNAPFCNSYYRLVFYRTLNKENEIAAQGVSRFLSYPEDLDDTRHTMTTGIGYYGDPDGNLPIRNIVELDKLKYREEVGTDVFVYGFNAVGQWKDSVISEILKNFLLSIYRNQLSVKVGNHEINSESLPEYMEMYSYKIKETYSFYQVLTDPNTKTFKKEFHRLGILKLKVLVNSHEKLNRKILITRTNGMKLFNIGNISKLISFSGILELEGHEINAYFREMETPAHDKWLPSRYSKNPEQAKRYYNELKQWLRDTVLSLGEYTSDEEIEVEGLGGVLQKESNNADEKGEDNKESLNDFVDKIIIQSQKTTQNNPKGMFYGTEGDGQSSSKKVKGTIGKKGSPATRKLGGTRKRTKKDRHVGLPTAGGRDDIHQRYGGDINQPIENVRIIKIGSDSYRVSFTAPKFIKKGHVEIVTVGENGKSNKLKIKSVALINGCDSVTKTSSGILFTNMSDHNKTKLEFSLVDCRDYAMEVNVYEYNR